MKEQYPSLYKDICKFVASGQFVPVGGTWVEMVSGLSCFARFVVNVLFARAPGYFKDRDPVLLLLWGRLSIYY